MKYVLTTEDIKEIGRWFLIISIPMTLLMIQQYRAPSNSWLNNGAGGVSGAQLTFSHEHVRASGTFSFINGTSDFFPYAEAFLIFGIVNRAYPNWLLNAATVANIVALPVSGSRTLTFYAALIGSCGVVYFLSRGGSFIRFFKAGAGALVIAVICLQIPVFQDSIASFADRWQSAGDQEGGGTQSAVQLRVLDSFSQPFMILADVPLLGNGIGLGSNAISVAKTGGQSFLLAEGEWLRIVQECGPIFGLVFLGYRFVLCATLFHRAFHLKKRNATFGLLLVAASVPQLLMNTVEQPTNLGFMVFGSGLCLAAASIRRIARDGEVVHTQQLGVAPSFAHTVSARFP